MKDEYIAETKVVKIAKSVITKTTDEENLLCPALSKNGISPLLPEMQIEMQVILKNNKSETKNAAASLKLLASFFVESLINSDESRQFIPTYNTGYKTLPLSVISTENRLFRSLVKKIIFTEFKDEKIGYRNG